MNNISEVGKIQESFNELNEKCNKSPSINEETLRTNFAKKEILEDLDYDEGEMFIEETISGQKRTDIHCTDEFGDVVFVIEFKKPSRKEPLESFKEDLKEKYVNPLKAKFGLLYDGNELLFYERSRNRLLLKKELSGKIEDFDRRTFSEIINVLEKPDYGTIKISNVIEYLENFKDEDERLALEEDISREHFYESFKLTEDSLFSKLVINLIDLFKEEKEESKFTKSAYQFWKRSYAKSLTKRQVPDDWKHIFKKTDLSRGRKEDRFIMTFCLETAFALFMRLILTKSCEDFGFPEAHFSDFLENEIKRASRSDNHIAQAAYPKISISIIRDMQSRLISSVFEEDIFYWWTEPFEDKRYHDFFSKTTPSMSKFGRSVAKILLAIYKFNFSRIEGDPLGILYQKYFDKETRKALGEFYTPQEVVEYILDSVEYKGDDVVDRRILDPACGSGTFLVEALKRYLDGAEKKAEQEGWTKVLDDLCNRYHIVGFDIHPFATIMAQVQFTLVLLPVYTKAKKEDPSFVLKRLPILRTDSLAKEKKTGRMKIEDYGVGQTFTMPIELPIQGKEGTFFEDDFRIPDDKTVYDHTDIIDIQEYFGALQAVFDSVKDCADKEKYEIDLEILEGKLKEYLYHKKWGLLAEFFEDYSNELLNKIKILKSDFEDGRLVKSIEDVMLAALLKNFVDYDFVVGNPPYVRIQDIPDKQKEKWSGNYDWTEGNYDIYVPFIERGLEWIKDRRRGKLSYIVSNRFLLTNYGKKMREDLPDRATIEKMIDLKDSRVFEDALNYPAIFVFSNGKTSRKNFPVARVFEDPDEGEELLEDIEDNLMSLDENNNHVVGDYSDAFYFKYDNLRGQGWYLMPPEEWEVFTHAEEVSDDILKGFTDSDGGFQGYATGKDAVFVLEGIEERKNSIIAYPKGGGELIEIEKNLVRPFLFGKDVERWKINWKGWFVLFPYKKYEINDEEKYKLIPSKEYKEKFDYGNEYIEDIFPKGWEYLKSIEDELRSREGGRYEKGKRDEYKWYGAGRPQNKEKYDKEKILLQVSSSDADIAYDIGDKFVFTAGGTSGVYGVLPNKNKISGKILMSIMNSHLMDFYLKHISTIYAGKSYSYGDQFIKLLPIKNPNDETLFNDIKQIVEKITFVEDLNQRLNLFPTPYFSELSKNEEIKDFFEIRHITKRYYKELNPKIQKDTEGNKKIKLGKDDYIDDYRINSDLKWNYIAKSLQDNKYSKNEEIILRIPKSDEKVQEILDMYESDKKKFDEGKSVKDLENELNENVYELYSIKEEINTINNFLDNF